MLYRLPRCRLSRVLWIALVVCAFVVLGDDRAEAEEVLASWYGPGFHGQQTANGEIYDAYGYTAAHKTLPLGTQIVVSYDGLSLPMTINDRGPYVGARELDLSQGAAEYLGLTRDGVDYVDYQVTAYGDNAYLGADSTHVDTGGASATEYYAAGYEDGGGLEAAPSGGGAYVVQSGDTLSGLAAAFGTTPEALAAANGIADPDVLFAGQTLYY